jgi:hypothetical protein
MSLNALITQLRNAPQNIEFNHVIQVINENYQYYPSTFRNGELTNKAGNNEGSCKILYFAQLHNLSKKETLLLFGHYFRNDVLQNPSATDHGNIRNFIKSGWQGIEFDDVALIKK